MDITLTLVEHHVWLVGQLVDRVERRQALLDRPVQDGLDDKPTVRSLLDVLVGQLEMWLDSVDGTPAGTDAGTTPADLRKRLADAGPRFVELTRRVVAEDRTEEVFRDGPEDHPSVFTYGGMIAHALSFGAHRRSLVIAVLAADGVDDLRNGDPMLYFSEVRDQADHRG